MMRAKTMTIPTTAATILFLWRVREASAKKSVLLWDVMVEGGGSAKRQDKREWTKSESLNPRIKRERGRNKRVVTLKPSSPCGVERGASVTWLHTVDRGNIRFGMARRGGSPSTKRLPAVFVRLQQAKGESRAGDVTSSGQSLLQFGLRLQQ